MPKIEVPHAALSRYAGLPLATKDELETWLMLAKGEVDEVLPDGRLKLEFNDTNRPDLWSTAGAGRLLRVYNTMKAPSYSFFSRPGQAQADGGRRVTVDPALKALRPYIAAFAVTGQAVDADALADLIQTQEKLCWNFGRKRKSIAMGVYRSTKIQYPVQYKAADPEATRFQPLGLDTPLSLREILKQHPKGQEYGHIVADLPQFPFLTDKRGEVLSFPPVINSADIGAVVEGDSELFIELTGTELPALTLAASIVACDLADAGFTILPVTVDYPYDTPFGRQVTFPYYFQTPVSADLAAVNKLVGLPLSAFEVQAALSRMGVASTVEGQRLTVQVPEYRNDFLHPVDIMEDVMIGHGLGKFAPVFPQDATVGRLSPEELFGRKVRDLMIGLGFQEMIYNYLGSGKDFIEKMNIPGTEVVQILNPMTENYEFVRNSIAPNLLESESVSGHAPYPHHIFEVGKVAFVDPSENTGSATRNSLGWLSADRGEGFNEINSRLAALMYHLNRDYTLSESADPRFLPGRAADVLVKGRKVGVIGEVHPQVLANWSVTVPTTLGEIDLDLVKGA